MIDERWEKMPMEIQTLATGFGLIEGPRVDAQDRLYFADHGSSSIRRRNPDGRLETLVAGRKSVGGLALCEGGGLLMSGPSLARWDEDEAVRENSLPLPGHDGVYMLRTTTDLRIFFRIDGDTITVLNVANLSVILASGGVSIGGAADVTHIPGEKKGK